MTFELWEMLKESIILSPVTFITVVALGLALPYVFWLMFGSFQPKHHRSSDFKQEVVVKDMTQVPTDTSSLSTFPSSPLWDVFLSFCGKDTCNFISNLYHALDQAGIVTFRDEPTLENGEEISPGLLNAIKNSKMFVVVISKNYADSSWCLDELAEILSCKRAKNQVVPVFYYVDPSDLRYQKGCFGAALKKHKKRYSVPTIDKWITALTEIAQLSGYHFKEEANESEAETIQKIVENVVPRTSKKVLNLERYLVGIDLPVEEIYQRLNMESNEVCALGICGMGGIGKTTIAKAFYDKYSYKFDISCFMENVKQYSQGVSPLRSLLQKLLIELLRVKDCEARDVQSALRKLKQILWSKKALIVLDDLDQSSYSEYLELLVRIWKLFSNGSRVIITARDVNLTNQLKVEMSQVETYMVKQLEGNDSLKLFSFHAFKKVTPPENYLALSRSFVTYTRGLPLALKVLGASLCGRTEVSFWKAKLEKVRKIPVEDIQKILQLSYDELEDETQKTIFLDIVFFFVGRKRDEADVVFESCGLFPDAGIPVLVERCLLTIDKDYKLQMHNLIQDMGNKVIREEAEHGKCQRLYLDKKEACQASQNLEGARKIKGLILDFTMCTDKYCNAKLFERVPNLRLLKLIDVHGIKGNFKTSFDELRWISWPGYPWTHLPSTIHLPKLVSCDISFSRIKILWKAVKLPCLRHLNLDGCKYLEELPESIGQLSKLEHLNVDKCVNLKRLPKPIVQLTSLSSLNMRHCSNLKVLPDQLGDMKGLQVLDASYTAIELLPDSISHLNKLIRLYLSHCKKLRKLPEQIGNMDGLEGFNAPQSAIEQLPDSFSNLLNLVHLNLYKCKDLTSLPNSIWKLKSLELLELTGCSQLNRLPEQLGKMQCLKRLQAYGSAIQELPDSIGELPRIQVLNFNHCRKLTYVPNSIRNLTSLDRLNLTHKDSRRLELPDDAVENIKLRSLEVRCNVREWLPMILSFHSLKKLHLFDYDECGSLSPTKPFSLFKLFNLEELVLINSTSHGSSFPELPLNIRSLRVSDHASLVQVPDLSNLRQLRELRIRGCRSLQSIQKFPPHLDDLEVCDCTSLQHLPDLSILRDLSTLNVTGNGSNLKVTLQDTHLQVRWTWCFSPNKKNTLTQVRQNKWNMFKASVQNKEIPEWFNYKSNGSRLCFEIPSILGDNFVGIAFWVVYKCTIIAPLLDIDAVITNKTEGIGETFSFDLRLYMISCVEGGVQSSVRCIWGDDFSIKSGDKIHVSFQVTAGGHEKLEEMLQVEMTGAHLILKTALASIPF